MLIDAEQSDYKDASRLMLVCPFCNEGIYLVKNHKRKEHARLTPKSKKIVLVKESSVICFFAHFYRLSQTCEAKSKNINQKDIEKAIARSRGQRLKILQRRFSQIVFDGSLKNTYYEYLQKANNIPAIYLQEVDQEIRNQICYNFDKNRDALKKYAKTLIRSAIEEPNKYTECQPQGIEWLLSLEVDLHLAIIDEVIDFLSTKSAKPLIDKLFDYGFQSWLNFAGCQDILQSLSLDTRTWKILHERYEKTRYNITYGMVAHLCGVQWANALHDFSEKNVG